MDTTHALPADTNTANSPAASNGRAVGELVSAKKKRYQGVAGGAPPYHADVDGRTYVFNRRPTARLQIQVMRRFVGRNDNDAVTAEDMDLLRDALAAMLADADEIDDLIDAVDLEALTEMLGDVMEAVTERPTTASSGSGEKPQTTTPAIGSPEQDSQTAISPV